MIHLWRVDGESKRRCTLLHSVRASPAARCVDSGWALQWGMLSMLAPPQLLVIYCCKNRRWSNTKFPLRTTVHCPSPSDNHPNGPSPTSNEMLSSCVLELLDIPPYILEVDAIHHFKMQFRIPKFVCSVSIGKQNGKNIERTNKEDIFLLDERGTMLKSLTFSEYSPDNWPLCFTHPLTEYGYAVDTATVNFIATQNQG